MVEITLSKEQREIVDHWLQNPGSILVKAGAGSGKTRVLTQSVKELLEIPRSKYFVLCLTFTNKAAEEMKERLSGVPQIKDRAFIGTIHSFALEIIRAFKHEVGYDEMPHIIERESDRRQILQDIFLENAFLNGVFNNPKEGVTLDKHQSKLLWDTMNFISKAKRRLVFSLETIPDNETWGEWRTYIFQEYNQRLRNQNLIDFEDILILAWRILTERNGGTNIYQRLYKYVLVDEAQDLNFAQYELIKALCGDTIKNVMMVGDDKQTIHGYADASKDYMLKHFVEDFNVLPDSQKVIAHNYRSAKEIIRHANLIMPNSAIEEDAFFKGVVETRAFSNESKEAEWIIKKIHDLLAGESTPEFEGKPRLEKMAILARNKFVFSTLQKHLDQDEQLKGKYYLKKGVDQLEPESTFMRVFELGTRILINRAGAIYQDQIKALLGLQAKATNGHRGIDFLQEIIGISPEVSGITKEELSGLIPVWKKISDNKPQGIFETLETAAKNIANENEKQLALMDIDEWQEAWRGYIRSVDAPSISFADFRRFVAIGQNVIKPKAPLTLATVHAVKGLEFHIVFLLGMGEGTFPDYRATTAQMLEEERNNAYVAITRAKRMLFVSYPKSKMMPWGDAKPQKRSRFLDNFEVMEEE